jgi:hypothetical protein
LMLNASERVPPETPAAAIYQNASSDGSRVFFTSIEALTNDAPLGLAHLYMWHRDDPNDEVQQLIVRATGGTFTLAFNGNTSGPLPANATAAQVETALDGLTSINSANGHVAVTGGPGDDTGSTPYTITFRDGLGRSNQPLITVDASALTGSAPAATVAPWVAGGGHLTVIDRDEEPADEPRRALGVISASADGTYIYFTGLGQLVKGAPPIAGKIGIFVWHDGQVGFIGTFDGGDWASNLPSIDGGGGPGGKIPSRVTPDGRALVFAAQNGSGLTGYNHAGCGGVVAGCVEFYVYHADTERLACASCNPNGLPALTNATNAAEFSVGGAVRASHRSKALSDDGRYVFFSSGDRLVPEDTNGRFDAYEYDSATGEIRLLSSGKSTSDSFFVDASSSGDNAFFITKERLVGWDVDDSYDIYDARIGGGLPEPAQPPGTCKAGDCQGPSTNAPPAIDPGSAAFSGVGNTAHVTHPPTHRRTKRCRRGTVRRHVHGSVRCVRRHRHHRRAQHNRHRRSA